MTLGVNCFLYALIILKNPGVTFLIKGVFSLVLKTLGSFVIRVSAQMSCFRKAFLFFPVYSYLDHITRIFLASYLLPLSEIMRVVVVCLFGMFAHSLQELQKNLV